MWRSMPLDHHRVDARGRLVEQHELRVAHQHRANSSSFCWPYDSSAARFSRSRRRPKSSRICSARARSGARDVAAAERPPDGRGPPAQVLDERQLGGRRAAAGTSWSAPAGETGRVGTARPCRRTPPMPASARRYPVTRLNSVVFPDPFGPMSAVIDPRGTSNEQPSTAVTPPKRLVRPRTSSSAVTSTGSPRAPRQDALRRARLRRRPAGAAGPPGSTEGCPAAAG